MMPMRMNGAPNQRCSFGKSCISQAISRIPEEMPSCAGWKRKPPSVNRCTESSCCIATTISPMLTT